MANRIARKNVPIKLPIIPTAVLYLFTIQHPPGPVLFWLIWGFMAVLWIVAIVQIDDSEYVDLFEE